MNYGGHFDINLKKEKIVKLQSETEKTDFWNNRESAEEILKELNELKDLVDGIEKLKNEIESTIDLLTLLEYESDEELLEEVNQTIRNISKETEELRLDHMIEMIVF